MAIHGGHPIDLAERPPHRRNCLPPSHYKLGKSRYTISHDLMTVYSLELNDDNILSHQDNAPKIDEFRHEGETSQSLAAAPEAAVAVAPLAWWAPGERGAVHPQAVPVGVDVDGGTLYVGRACVQGDLLPGKVAPSHRVCYVALAGKEIALPSYEVLVVERGLVDWVRCKGGAVPPDALPAGLTLRDQTVYAACAPVQGIVTPGQLVQGERKCRISFDMKEFELSEYEVLTLRPLIPSRFSGNVRHIIRPMKWDSPPEDSVANQNSDASE